MERAVLAIHLTKFYFYFLMQLIDSISSTYSLEPMEAETPCSQEDTSAQKN